MGRVDGKVVVITGAAGGQGAAEAQALAAEGATVIATDLEAPELGHGISGRALDVTSAEDWRALGEWLRDSHGRLHGLVNNAGITMRQRLEEISLEELDQVLAVNLKGPLLGMQTAIPLMTDGGSIVNVSSLAGLVGYHGVGYTASKWALRGISRAASMELGPRGIRVNAICPGFIETPMTASAPQSFRQASIDAIPLHRTGQPDDVAPLVVYLISDESSFITGIDIPVDGGEYGHGGAMWLSEAVRKSS
jgi:3alpha(or 20beta)-hydroxysteroid dehydrogenase